MTTTTTTTNAPPAYNDAAATTSTPTITSLFPSLEGERVVLCSSSPRRLALIQHLGLSPEVIPSGYAENLSKSDFGLTPWEYATRTATEKILAVYRHVVEREDKQEPKLLIAADTIVLAGHTILEKPDGPAAHLAMLRALRRAGTHKVFTAVAVLAPNETMPVAPGYVLKTHLEETAVTFDETVSDDVLVAYVQHGDGGDKAGGYAIQGGGALLVKRVEGSYDSVVGLPVNATYSLIREVLNWDAYGGDDDDDDDEEE